MGSAFLWPAVTPPVSPNPLLRGSSHRALDLELDLEAVIVSIQSALHVHDYAAVRRHLADPRLQRKMLTDIRVDDKTLWKSTATSLLFRCSRNGEDFVIKEPAIMDAQGLSPMLRELLQNARLMKGFNHDNVVVMRGFTISERVLREDVVLPVVSLVFPHQRLGSVRSWLDDFARLNMSPPLWTKLSILLEVARGMNAINELANGRNRRIVHRDLHSGNVLLDGSERPAVDSIGNVTGVDTVPVAKVPRACGLNACYYLMAVECAVRREWLLLALRFLLPSVRTTTTRLHVLC